MLSKKKVIASCQGRANTKVCTHAFLHSKNKSLVLFHLGLFHLGSAHIKKIWTKCVENYLFQVHGHEEQSCFSLSFQRKPSNKAPHAVTHLTHSHTHGTLTGTGFLCSWRGRKQHQTTSEPTCPHCYHYGLVKAVRVTLTDLYLKCTRVPLCSG